jgi:tetratricopeptide (TPR) repeat protein
VSKWVSGRRFRSVHPDRLSCLEGAGGQYERALAIGEAAHGANHPDVAAFRNNLGRVLQDLGDLEGARMQLERALAISEAALGPDHPTAATMRANLGNMLQALQEEPSS